MVIGALVFALSHLFDTFAKALHWLSAETASLVHLGIVLLTLVVFVVSLSNIALIIARQSSLEGQPAPFSWFLPVTLAGAIGVSSFIIFNFSLLAAIWSAILLNGALLMLAGACFFQVLRTRPEGAIRPALWLALLGLLVFSLAHPLHTWLGATTTLEPAILGLLHRLLVMPAFLLFAFSVESLPRVLELTKAQHVLARSSEEGGHDQQLDFRYHLLKLAVGHPTLLRLQAPQAILNLACGTGLWAREMAQAFPRAVVSGVDLDLRAVEKARLRAAQAGGFPANVRFLQVEALDCLPFADGAFDVIHAGFLSSLLPKEAWAAVIAEIVRVARPGGFIEVWEGGWPTSPSLTYQALRELAQRWQRACGLEPEIAASVADYLRQACVIQVHEQHLVVGAGRAHQRERRLIAAYLLAKLRRLQPSLVQGKVLHEQDAQHTLDRAEKELAAVGASWPITMIAGRRA